MARHSAIAICLTASAVVIGCAAHASAVCSDVCDAEGDACLQGVATERVTARGLCDARFRIERAACGADRSCRKTVGAAKQRCKDGAAQFGSTATDACRTRRIDCLACCATAGSLEACTDAVEYPLFDPSVSYAAARHAGESRVGSVGTIAKRTGTGIAEAQPSCPDRGAKTRCRLHFSYAFAHPDEEEFVGVFFSLGRIGLSTAKADPPTCSRGSDLDLHHDGTFDWNDLLKNSFDGAVAVENLRLVLRPDGREQTLTIKVELEDSAGRKAFTRLDFDSRGANALTVDLGRARFVGTLDYSAVKILALVVEERHVSDGITNPAEGGFDVELVALIDDDGPRLGAAVVQNLAPIDLVRTIARRNFEALLRLTDPKTGAVMDRTLFRDLLHVGATGWLLAALPGAVQEGWIELGAARELALRILRYVDDDGRWGDASTGTIGNSRGLFYRFWGIDAEGLNGPLTGTRKLDVGDCNAVEASTIDTAIFDLGAATCASGFPGDHPDDVEIRMRVDRILRRTAWDEILDPVTGQMRLAWKPDLDATPGCFTAPAAFGGYWASREGPGGRCPDPDDAEPLTIDFWTDEGGMVAILAAGSTSHSTGPDPWYRMIRRRGKGISRNVVLTFPGAWFTYAFLGATYLDPTLGPDRGSEFGTTSVDWFLNSQRAFTAYQALQGSARSTILPDAVEHPDTRYTAQGRRQLAVDASAHFDGTRTPWSLELALGLGPSIGPRATEALRNAFVRQPGVWDPLVGLLDAYHPDLQDYDRKTGHAAALSRKAGRWIQQQAFSLNKGAALAAELNYLDDGVVWRAANAHPVVRNGIDRIYGRTPPITSGAITSSGGHDWWSIALSEDRVLIPDGFQETLSMFDAHRQLRGVVSSATIGDLLETAGIGVERSAGPAGLRAATRHPNGGWIVLIAGPGTNTLIRVDGDLDLTVLSTSFGAAMTRGDEIENFPRIAVGGVPAAILVTVGTPRGIAVVALGGTLLHTILLEHRYHGIAPVPGTNEAFLLRDDGAIERLPDLYDESLAPIPFAALPNGVAGRDLTYNASWIGHPNLLASGSDGVMYAIDPTSGSVDATHRPGVEDVVALDVLDGRAVFGRDESAWLDAGS